LLVETLAFLLTVNVPAPADPPGNEMLSAEIVVVLGNVVNPICKFELGNVPFAFVDPVQNRSGVPPDCPLTTANPAADQLICCDRDAYRSVHRSVPLSAS
jgi:hypothetical protein